MVYNKCSASVAKWILYESGISINQMTAFCTTYGFLIVSMLLAKSACAD